MMRNKRKCYPNLAFPISIPWVRNNDWMIKFPAEYFKKDEKIYLLSALCLQSAVCLHLIVFMSEFVLGNHFMYILVWWNYQIGSLFTFSCLFTFDRFLCVNLYLGTISSENLYLGTFSCVNCDKCFLMKKSNSKTR